MKKLLLLGTFIMGTVLINNARAQFGVSVNIGAQPAWGPSGYDYAEYYYLPDIEAYYCIPTRQFTWFQDGQWITSPYLPDWCSNYDLYSGYKVVINERNPWFHFNEHRERYAPYRYRHDQLVIRDGGRANYGSGRAYYGGNYRADYGRPSYNYRAENEGWNNRPRNDGWNRNDNRGPNQNSGYARNNNGYAPAAHVREDRAPEYRAQENRVQQNHGQENRVQQNRGQENHVREPQYRDNHSGNDRGGNRGQRNDNNRGNDNGRSRDRGR